MEMKFYRDMLLPHVEDGSVASYELQKPYELQPSFKRNGKTVKAIFYVADFYIESSDGRTVVIDIKGHADSVALLKRKMFWYKYPDTEYLWLCLSKIDGGWRLWEDVQAARRQRKKNKLKKETDTNGKNSSEEEEC